MQKTTAPYLDRIVTAPHFPRPEGCEGVKSTQVFPDLDHTGIRSKYSAPQMHCTSLDGVLTKMWKDAAFKQWDTPARWNEELKARERSFRSADKIFLNKILIEYDEEKKKSLQRIRDHFYENFESMDMKDLFAPGSAILGGEGAASGDQSTTSSRQFSSRIGTSSGKSERAPTRQRKAFDKMSMFQCLLETREPPKSPLKRYGRAVSPSASGSLHNWDSETIRRVNTGDDELNQRRPK